MGTFLLRYDFGDVCTDRCILKKLGMACFNFGANNIFLILSCVKIIRSLSIHEIERGDLLIVVSHHMFEPVRLALSYPLSGSGAIFCFNRRVVVYA